MKRLYAQACSIFAETPDLTAIRLCTGVEVALRYLLHVNHMDHLPLFELLKRAMNHDTLGMGKSDSGLYQVWVAFEKYRPTRNGITHQGLMQQFDDVMPLFEEFEYLLTWFSQHELCNKTVLRQTCGTTLASCKFTDANAYKVDIPFDVCAANVAGKSDAQIWEMEPSVCVPLRSLSNGIINASFCLYCAVCCNKVFEFKKGKVNVNENKLLFDVHMPTEMNIDIGEIEDVNWIPKQVENTHVIANTKTVSCNCCKLQIGTMYLFSQVSSSPDEFKIMFIDGHSGENILFHSLQQENLPAGVSSPRFTPFDVNAHQNKNGIEHEIDEIFAKYPNVKDYLNTTTKYKAQNVVFKLADLGAFPKAKATKGHKILCRQLRIARQEKVEKQEEIDTLRKENELLKMKQCCISVTIKCIQDTVAE